MSVADRLAGLDEDFEQARIVGGVGELPEDGEYQGVVEDFDFLETNSGLLLKTVIRLVGTANVDGWKIDTIHNLEDPERFTSLKTHLSRMGADVENFRLSQIEEITPLLLDTVVDLTVKTSDTISEKTGKPFRNVYVDRAHGKVPSRTPVPDVPADAEGLGQQVIADAAAAKTMGGREIQASNADDDIPF